MITAYVIIGLLMGIVFGFALEKGRVFEPGMIVGQLQLRNFIVAKMFLTATALTAVVFVILTALGWVEFHAKATIVPGILVGGFLFGVGIAITGACPGTVLAQIGAGYRDALFTLAGALLGALSYGYLEPWLSSFQKDFGELTLQGLTGWPFWLIGSVAAITLLIAVWQMEKHSTWKQELGENFDGYREEPTIKEKRVP